MTTPIPDDLPQVLESLKNLSQLPDPHISTAAAQWLHSLAEKQTFLAGRDHPVVFIGKPGVGKSSVINVVSNLLLSEAPPTDKVSLKNLSVLATGAGRTSICEVQVKGSERPEYLLEIEPFESAQMEQEIDLYARAEWQRFSRNDIARRPIDEDADPSAQEWQRAIRYMTGYAESYESYRAEDGSQKKRLIKPLEAQFSAFDSETAFAKHMIARANLSSRTRTIWSWSADKANLKELKKQFEALNQGSEATAMLPQKIIVSIAPPFLSNQSGLDLQLIDTRGLDGPMSARADLYDWLRNPRSVVILCSSFKEAPDILSRTLLRDMADDALLQDALSRSILLLLDQGDASQVNGADNDREIGQLLKLDECANVLDGNQLTLRRERMLTLDVLQDNCDALLDMVVQSVVRQHETATQETLSQLADAQAFIRDVGNVELSKLQQLVDEELKVVMATNLPSGAPLLDPLAGMYAAIHSTHASIVWASCRRSGSFRNLDLYAAVKSEAARSCTSWLNNLQTVLRDKLQKQNEDHRFDAVRNHIGLRRLQIDVGPLRVIEHYAQAVTDEIRAHLKHDDVWIFCKEEWGQGAGFKDRVLAHLKSWSAKQVRFDQYMKTEINQHIPLLNEVMRPAQVPRFVLFTRNLRTLREVNWAPEPLSILIGANGAGKTTLLLVLYLLHVAYERDLPEAVNQVLGGIHNLRSWGVDESAAVEIGLDIDQLSWRLTLTPNGASASYLTRETLQHGEQEVFARDQLGNFRYQGQSVEPSPLLGLRALMDRGATEPAIRTVAIFMQRIAFYRDLDLYGLRTQGSEITDNRTLHLRGGNTLAILRRWNQNLQEQHRFKFVLDGLRTAFPNTVGAMDFDEGGNFVAARFYKPDTDIPGFLRTEANGVIQLMVLLCAIASAKDESIIAIDEPENCLHPYAIAVFLRHARRWAQRHKLTLLFATHSTVLLDELSAEPESVFVMKCAENSHSLPTQLSLLCNRDWLSGFKLGDLYEQGEIGSNEDDV
jgi:predicted ATPase/GTPase SAR1 family protein